jgi:ATP-dependent protease ClpP protease subunit
MSTEIRIEGIIGRGDNMISAADVRKQLAAIAADADIDLHIDSLGGDAFEALAINESLQSHAGRIAVKIGSVCAGAAYLIAVAGDHISIDHNGFINVSHFRVSVDDASIVEFQKQIDVLKSLTERAVALITASRMHAPVFSKQALQEAMDDDCWHTAVGTVQAGLADGVLEREAAAGMGRAVSRAD